MYLLRDLISIRTIIIMYIHIDIFTIVITYQCDNIFPIDIGINDKLFCADRVESALSNILWMSVKCLCCYNINMLK